MRTCPHCQRSYAPSDYSRGESRRMETERIAAGLQGLRFRFYQCSACSSENIFVEVLPRDGEQLEEFESRRAAMENVVRGLESGRVGAVVVPVSEA